MLIKYTVGVPENGKTYFAVMVMKRMVEPSHVGVPHVHVSSFIPRLKQKAKSF